MTRSSLHGDVMSSQYVQVTRALHEKYLACYGDPFVARRELSKKLKKVVERIVKKNGELFISEVIFVTERLTLSRVAQLVEVARKLGFDLEYKERSMNLKYLYSNGYGHYSTDFYRILMYATVRITLAQQLHSVIK